MTSVKLHFVKLLKVFLASSCSITDLLTLSRHRKITLSVEVERRKVLVLQRQDNEDIIIGECEISGIFKATTATTFLPSHPTAMETSNRYFQFEYLHPTEDEAVSDSRIRLKWSQVPNHSTRHLPFDIKFLSEGRYLLTDRQTTTTQYQFKWHGMSEEDALALLRAPLSKNLSFRLFDMGDEINDGVVTYGNRWFHFSTLGLTQDELDKLMVESHKGMNTLLLMAPDKTPELKEAGIPKPRKKGSRTFCPYFESYVASHAKEFSYLEWVDWMMDCKHVFETENDYNRAAKQTDLTDNTHDEVKCVGLIKTRKAKSGKDIYYIKAKIRVGDKVNSLKLSGKQIQKYFKRIRDNLKSF